MRQGFAAIRLTVLAAWLMAAALAGPAVAGPFEDAGEAYKRGDYATAMRLMRPLADQGNARAQHNLGFMYDKGEGVPQNHAEAVKWYRRAADQGDPRSQFNLGGMYSNGQGVPQDHAEAVKWYRRAADQGDAWAQLDLGFMYLNGLGVPQDYVQSHKWSNLAASRLPVSEKEVRDNAVKNRDLAAARMTPAQIAEAQKLAREWRPKPETK